MPKRPRPQPSAIEFPPLYPDHEIRMLDSLISPLLLHPERPAVCSRTASTVGVHVCLACGSQLSGRAEGSPVSIHFYSTGHCLFLSYSTLTVHRLPDDTHIVPPPNSLLARVVSAFCPSFTVESAYGAIRSLPSIGLALGGRAGADPSGALSAAIRIFSLVEDVRRLLLCLPCSSASHRHAFCGPILERGASSGSSSSSPSVQAAIVDALQQLRTAEIHTIASYRLLGALAKTMKELYVPQRLRVDCAPTDLVDAIVERSGGRWGTPGCDRGSASAVASCLLWLLHEFLEPVRAAGIDGPPTAPTDGTAVVGSLRLQRPLQRPIMVAAGFIFDRAISGWASVTVTASSERAGAAADHRHSASTTVSFLSLTVDAPARALVKTRSSLHEQLTAPLMSLLSDAYGPGSRKVISPASADVKRTLKQLPKEERAALSTTAGSDRIAWEKFVHIVQFPRWLFVHVRRESPGDTTHRPMVLTRVSTPSDSVDMSCLCEASGEQLFDLVGVVVPESTTTGEVSGWKTFVRISVPPGHPEWNPQLPSQWMVFYATGVVLEIEEASVCVCAASVLLFGSRKGMADSSPRDFVGEVSALLSHIMMPREAHPATASRGT